MKDKIIALLYKYRIDFSTEPNYTDFGIAEDKFNDLADDLTTLIDKTKEEEEQQTRLNEYYSED